MAGAVTHVAGSRTARAGSRQTAPAGPGPGRPPRCAAAAPPAPSRPCGPGRAAPAPPAGTCGRADDRLDSARDTRSPGEPRETHEVCLHGLAQRGTEHRKPRLSLHVAARARSEQAPDTPCCATGPQRIMCPAAMYHYACIPLISPVPATATVPGGRCYDHYPHSTGKINQESRYCHTAESQASNTPRSQGTFHTSPLSPPAPRGQTQAQHVTTKA